MNLTDIQPTTDRLFLYTQWNATQQQPVNFQLCDRHDECIYDGINDDHQCFTAVDLALNYYDTVQDYHVASDDEARAELAHECHLFYDYDVACALTDF